VEGIERAIGAAIYNARGMHMRPVGEGGRQERDLADKYRNYARTLAKWPRTARLMTHIAEGYESDGRRADLRAKTIDESGIR
jgi:hypothetical protein